jgi:hypothetical protein
MGLWRRYLDWRQRHVAAITLTADGFRVVQGAAGQSVAWDEITRITAFKRDLMAYDRICVAMMLGDSTIEIDEQMPGFVPWREAMEQRFAVSPCWYLEIMTPVFEPTPMDLYRLPEMSR